MKNKLKKSLLLCMLVSFLFALSGCQKEETLNFEVDRDSMVNTTKSIISRYYETDEMEQEYYLNDGSDLEKSAVGGFIAAETTDHVGSFESFKEDSTAEIKNGANGKVNCSVLCKYQKRDVKVTVSYTQNRKFELDKQAAYETLNNQAAQYGMDLSAFIMQMYGNYPELDMSSMDKFLDSYLAAAYNETRYIPEEVEVSALYSSFLYSYHLSLVFLNIFQCFLILKSESREQRRKLHRKLLRRRRKIQLLLVRLNQRQKLLQRQLLLRRHRQQRLMRIL